MLCTPHLFIYSYSCWCVFLSVRVFQKKKTVFHRPWLCLWLNNISVKAADSFFVSVHVTVVLELGMKSTQISHKIRIAFLTCVENFSLHVHYCSFFLTVLANMQLLAWREKKGIKTANEPNTGII